VPYDGAGKGIHFHGVRQEVNGVSAAHSIGMRCRHVTNHNLERYYLGTLQMKANGPRWESIEALEWAAQHCGISAETIAAPHRPQPRSSSGLEQLVDFAITHRLARKSKGSMLP